MSTVGSLRRYALMKRRAAEEVGDLAIRDVWKGKQEAEPGTDLASDFPSRTRLVALGYSTMEDLIGADACELGSLGFGTRDTAAILAAVS